MTYQEQLRDKRWLHRRQQIIDKAENKCEHCGDEDCNLEVHHGFYLKGKMAWEYPDEVLYCVCRDCHYTIQGLMELCHYEIAKRSLYLYSVYSSIKKSAKTRAGDVESFIQHPHDDYYFHKG